MIITKEFIMLNLPKTGSTFARTVLKELYKPNLFQKILIKLKVIPRNLIELKLPNIKMPNLSLDQHGTYIQIPKKYMNRDVFSVIRNPYSRLLSSYQFRSWANPNQLTVDKSILERDFPTFPDLDMDTYIDLLIESEKTRLQFFTGNNDKIDIGIQTIQFIQMFFKNPKEVLTNISDEYFESGAYKNDLGVTTFIKQEQLNDELYRLLKDYKFKDNELAFIKTYKKINVTKANKDKRSDLWTQKALDYVAYRERYLFKILKDLNIVYNQPN